MFDSLKDRLESIFKGLKSKGKLTEEDVAEALREIRRALLEADVNFKIVKDLMGRIRERAVGREVLDSITPGQQVSTVVFEELVSLMGEKSEPLIISSQPPTRYMMVGLQGSGKTTSCGKLAKRLSKGHKPLLVACDLQRPAAVEQLRVLAKTTGVGFFGPSEGEKDPVGLAKKALAYATEHLYDVLLFDTAGRLHVDQELMDQLGEIREVVEPHEILLVVDSMAGQEAVNVAEAFHAKVPLSGLVLSKLDGDARGGAALAVRAATGVPVKLAGVGEGIEDLEIFDAPRMVQRIMGMGDIMGLVEKVQQATDSKDADRLVESLQKKQFSMEDLLLQIEQIQKMGPLEKVMDMIPGMGKLKQQMGNAEMDPKRILRIKAIIQSMTKKERLHPEIIKGSRRRRIAQGSGTTVQMVNQVLKQHKDMQALWKKLGKGGPRKGMRGMKNFLPFG